MEPCNEEHPLSSCGLQWLEEIFLVNSISIPAFLRDVEMIFGKNHPKIRTLFLEGASNAGKTLVQELVLSGRGNVGYAALQPHGQTAQFELMPILGADCAVISEFRATTSNVDRAKSLFGGEKMSVDRKNKTSVTLQPPPVLVTAQTGWDRWLGTTDRTAIQNRCRTYKMLNPLKECSVRICPCYWEELCEKWLSQQHQDKEPSVPAWTKWKQMEESKDQTWAGLGLTGDSSS